MSDPHGSPTPVTHGDQVPDVHGSSHAVEGAHGSTADHGDGHGHDDHGHASADLGPVDWPIWGAGILGVVIGLVTAAGFVAATGFSFGA